MSYTNVQDVKREAGMLHNDRVSVNEVQQYVDDICAAINDCLVVRYVMPITGQTNYPGSDAEKRLRSLAKKIAAAELTMRLFSDQEGTQYVKAEDKANYYWDQLKMYSTGEKKLLGTDYQELPTIDDAGNTVSGNLLGVSSTRIFPLSREY